MGGEKAMSKFFPDFLPREFNLDRPQYRTQGLGLTR